MHNKKLEILYFDQPLNLQEDNNIQKQAVMYEKMFLKRITTHFFLLKVICLYFLSRPNKTIGSLIDYRNPTTLCKLNKLNTGFIETYN